MHREPVIEGTSDASHQDEGRDSHALEIGRLFGEHNAALLRFLTAQGHSVQDARDIAQEAYVKLLNLDSPGTVSFLRAFLYRTAANLAKDRRKQQQVHDRLNPLIFFGAEEVAPPEPLCCARQELDLIEKALEELPPHCRLAFILVKFREMSFDEAAAALRTKAPNVRRYVARAIAHCQKALATSRAQGRMR